MRVKEFFNRLLSGIELAIRSELIAALNTRGSKAVPLEEGQKEVFDLQTSKGQSLPEGVVRADFVIDEFRCEWGK